MVEEWFEASSLGPIAGLRVCARVVGVVGWKEEELVVSQLVVCSWGQPLVRMTFGCWLLHCCALLEAVNKGPHERLLCEVPAPEGCTDGRSCLHGGGSRAATPHGESLRGWQGGGGGGQSLALGLLVSREQDFAGSLPLWLQPCMCGFCFVLPTHTNLY